MWINKKFVGVLALSCFGCIQVTEMSIVEVEDLSFDLEITNKSTNQYIYDSSQILQCKHGDELEMTIIIDDYYTEAAYTLITTFYNNVDTIRINSPYKQTLIVPETINKGKYPISVVINRLLQNTHNDTFLKTEITTYSKENDTYAKIFTIQVD